MTRRVPISLFRLASASPALILLIAVGCGGPAYEYDATVNGIVIVDGELANSGLVMFHPVGTGGKPAIGRIHRDGSYSLRTGQGNLREEDGGTVVSGDYVITVSVTGPADEDSPIAEGGPPKPGPSLLASKYASKETSDLKRTVKQGPQVVNLELEGAATEAPADETTAGQTGTTDQEPGNPAAPPAEDAPQEARSASSTESDNATADDAPASASASEDSAEKQSQ